jgi:GTPase SAR1 family protein
LLEVQMNTCFKWFVFSILIICVIPKRFALIGETGAGKSSLINSLCGVNAKTGRFVSITNQTKEYNCSYSKIPFFHETTFVDTAGTFEVNGTSDREILSEIEGYYLKYLNTSDKAITDGFIIPVYTRGNRVRFDLVLSYFVATFSKSIVKSLVIVINADSSDNASYIEDVKAFVTERAFHAAIEAFPEERVKIPIVLINAINPTREQIAQLTAALSVVSPYYHNDLQEKIKAIREIYEKLLANPENYRKEIEKIIEEEQQIVEKQGLKKVPIEVTETKSDGCRVSFNLLGIIQMCVPNTFTETKTLLIDEVITLNESQVVPVVRDKEKEVLKNELQVYWILAVDKYEDMHRKKYVKDLREQHNREL